MRERFVTVMLRYKLTGDTEAAITDAERSLAQAYSPRQGRVESISGAGPNGSYDAVCIAVRSEHA